MSLSQPRGVARVGVFSASGDGVLCPPRLPARSISLLGSGNDKKIVEFGVNNFSASILTVKKDSIKIHQKEKLVKNSIYLHQIDKYLHVETGGII